MCWSPFFRGGFKKVCPYGQPVGYRTSRTLSVPITRKKVRYLIWKVKSTRYDASDFFFATPTREERSDRWSKRADLFDPSYLSDSDSVAYRARRSYCRFGLNAC